MRYPGSESIHELSGGTRGTGKGWRLALRTPRGTVSSLVRAALALSVWGLLACSASVFGDPIVKGGSSQDGDGADGSEGADDGSSDTDPSDDGSTDGTKYDVGPGDCEDELPPADATLTGIVVAPNRIVPVSGALVYFADTRPAGIPDHVYCAECVTLPCDVRYTFTEADGTFTLPVSSSSGRYLAVQKGQFLRITEIDVTPGTTALDLDATSLPDHLDPDTGQYIPNVALAYGVHDRLEHALGKLGLAETLIDEDAVRQTYIPGTETWDTWENGLEPDTTNLGPFEDLLRDYEKLESYHIVFVPCSNDAYESAFSDPAVLENVRRWVEAGGKWYVAEWSNEYLDIPFGQYQTFFDNGYDTDLEAYDSIGTVLDHDLLAWLAALPPALKDINEANWPFDDYPTINDLPGIDLIANGAGIEETPPVWASDGEGGQVDVGHHVWVEGPGGGDVPPGIHPMVVTGEYGCGRIMFTTFHTTGGGSYIGLTPQELVLLYLILEIGVCQTPHDIPP
jgi:hypothetical protein